MICIFGSNSFIKLVKNTSCSFCGQRFHRRHGIPFANSTKAQTVLSHPSAELALTVGNRTCNGREAIH